MRPDPASAITPARRSRPLARVATVLALAAGGLLALASPATATATATAGVGGGPSSGSAIVVCSSPVLTPGGVRIGVPCDDPCSPVTPLCDPIPARDPLAP